VVEVVVDQFGWPCVRVTDSSDLILFCYSYLSL